MNGPDFNLAAQSFRGHGWQADRLADALWRFHRPGVAPRMRLLLSAGVHGDETAPIEMLSRRLPQWAHEAGSLALDLLVAIGNLDAVRAGKRFLRHDMNRMFGAGGAKAGWGAEGARAALLQHGVAAWMREPRGAPVVHLDLHTTIRPSLKPTFAIVPGDDAGAPLLRWLASAGLDAAVLNPGPNVTFSAFSARLGAAACTVELGSVRAFGDNDHGLLARFEEALDDLVRGRVAWEEMPAGDAPGMQVFWVTREILRTSDRFELLVPASAPNFTVLEPGQELARDEAGVLHADGGEALLFPNPSVAVGLRAGLLAVPVDRR